MHHWMSLQHSYLEGLFCMCAPFFSNSTCDCTSSMHHPDYSLISWGGVQNCGAADDAWVTGLGGWKKAKRACTSGTCSSVLRTLLDVELLNALIQSVQYCISIYTTPPYHPLSIYCFALLRLTGKNLLPCFGLFVLCTAPRNYDCTTPQSLASGLRRRLLELEGYPPSHLMNPRGSRLENNTYFWVLWAYCVYHVSHIHCMR